MSYVDLDQLTDRYGEALLVDLTDRATPATGEIDADVVARAIADTKAVIDGHLAGRYKLPLAETPQLVVDLALQIAIYKLHRFTPNDKIKDDYKAAMGLLAKIASGTVRLDVEGVEPASSGSSGVQTNDRERPFTNDNLKGFI
ncbi:MAG: DUF1320 domain-containing protein [Erythrobacter sp.]|nr:DUF1320 domain-containing protein [Erythrobacter sp.]NCQ62462.1 DUF1320 domain-containing protein [Alphaproteobacteria bacterium]